MSYSLFDKYIRNNELLLESIIRIHNTDFHKISNTKSINWLLVILYRNRTVAYISSIINEVSAPFTRKHRMESFVGCKTFPATNLTRVFIVLSVSDVWPEHNTMNTSYVMSNTSQSVI